MDERNHQTSVLTTINGEEWARTNSGIRTRLSSAGRVAAFKIVSNKVRTEDMNPIKCRTHERPESPVLRSYTYSTDLTPYKLHPWVNLSLLATHLVIFKCNITLSPADLPHLHNLALTLSKHRKIATPMVLGSRHRRVQKLRDHALHIMKKCLPVHVDLDGTMKEKNADGVVMIG